MPGHSEWLREKLDAVHDEVTAIREEIGDDRRFLIEMNRRSELAFQGMMRRLEELGAETRESIRVSRETARVTRESADMVRDCAEATRAHTRAVLSLLDRFGDGPAPAGGSA
ncbi:MAG TPA: hypothetical protein VNB64_00735 [Solirubrobacteraceae bacterium]|nr:hypothetical protein [Solirubrobacteraceae bacterium]